jgi:LruC domain-containing protein
VASATLSTAGRAAQPLAPESGQTEATFIVTPSVQAQMPVSSDANCPCANTKAGCATVPAVPYRLEVNFANPQASGLFSAPYNPFIFRSARRGQEVHLPSKPATQRADSALFGTSDDRTPPTGGGSTTYMDAQRRPWALDIPVAWRWPLEVTDLLKPFPRFQDWALSSGANARDWYLNGTVPQYLAPQRP